MRRLPAILGTLAFLLVPSTPARAAVVPVEVAGGLAFPAAFAFTPDGRIFYGERFRTCTGLHPQSTNQDGPEPRILPEVFYESPMIAPTGAAFCQACGLPGHEGNLVFGAWNDGILRSLALDAERDDVASQSVPHDHTSGVLAVERRPDGGIYGSDPDQIFKLVST